MATNENLIQAIKLGKIPTRVKTIALNEGVDPELLAFKISLGTVVVPANINRPDINPTGIGEGLSTKINANIGTSDDIQLIDEELKKLQVALDAGADTIMDLSTGGDIKKIRQKILKNCSAPVGTVPIYEAAINAQINEGSIVNMTDESIFKVIENQAKEGVDFMTVHAGVNRKSLDALIKQERIMDMVSRGGAFTVGWMLQNDKENPLFKNYPRLLDIAKKYDVTLSLGDGMRPGSIADASDRPQISELSILAELVHIAREAGVQVIVEGPGHVPLDQIETNVKLEKQLTDNAPFYVLGPLVTDIAAGFDHITGAIGGAIAAAAGCDFLCYVTPKEHLGLPNTQDVKQGVIASKIAAHAADIVKKVPGAFEMDVKMSKARKALDWDAQIKASLDPKTTRKEYEKRKPAEETACTMCGPYCAMKLVSEYLGTDVGECS